MGTITTAFDWHPDALFAAIRLLASDGLRNAEIADRMGVSPPAVDAWRYRYVDSGMAGLVDVDQPWPAREVRPAEDHR